MHFVPSVPLSLSLFGVILTFGTTGVALVKLAGHISRSVGGGSHDKCLAVSIFIAL